MLFFIRHVGVREIEIFRAKQADAAGSHGDRGPGVDAAVDVGEQFQIDAVLRARRLITIGGELVLEKEELPLQLQIGAALLRIGVDQDVPAAGIDDDGIPRFHMAENVPHA